MPENSAPEIDLLTGLPEEPARSQPDLALGAKSLMEAEMASIEEPASGGVLCRPQPAVQQVEVWKRGVSDPRMDLALFVDARPQRVAHAPLSVSSCAARTGPRSGPFAVYTSGFASVPVRAGGAAGTNRDRLVSGCFGRNVLWR